MIRKRRGMERVRAMRETIIREDHHGKNKTEEGGGKEEGDEEDIDDPKDLKGGRVGNSLKVLHMGNECSGGDVRE